MFTYSAGLYGNRGQEERGKSTTQILSSKHYAGLDHDIKGQVKGLTWEALKSPKEIR